MNIAFIRKEMSYFKKMCIAENTVEKEYTYSQVCIRELEEFQSDERDCEDRLFLINIQNKYQILGFKIMIDYFKNQGNASVDMDSRITADMLLGIFKEIKIENNKVTATYYPFEQGEKKYAFHRIKEDVNVEVTYPIVLNQDQETMLKWEDVWEQRSKEKTEEQLVKFLSDTEPHLRKYTQKVLRDNQKVSFKIYDPACSTGKFLEYVKEKFNGAYTIGHDMDENMVRMSKDKVDESACCNAFDSAISQESVDILVLRFLNYAVVNRLEAKELFEKLISTVRNGGMIICFGHTPVLLNTSLFESFGVKVIGKIGYDQSTDSIFQYYVMER
ncbi:Uncharacterised protein [Clostridium putrefaciens]|uniref:Methyltransferase type 11 domain-containing protein n=1 Tax=Clostridium putrefaciens TaxID=99675 RepID=A0A381J816_9CLOT|nr:class I SAM-dependent methyltransferase [Clostridium putrefaciens]SUY47133.1 Uncharacterised protein [Clostridium putrefaciens]